MNGLILHTRQDEPLSLLDILIAFGGKKLDENVVVLDSDEQWLAVRYSSSVLNDYDNDLHEVLALVEDPKSYLLEWRGDELLKEFLSKIPDDYFVVVDNDHGIISALQFVKKIPIEDWIREKTVTRTESPRLL
jgi:hypothetical protein